MTCKEAAERTGLEESTIRRLARAGTIRATRHGRDWWIPEAELARIPIRTAGRPAGRPRKKKP